MTIEVLRTTKALYALGDEWQDLFTRCPDATPFQSPAWLLPWWHVFGTARPVVATLRNRSRLTAVLPLYVLEDKLLPIGAGITDYQDILLDPAEPSDAASALLSVAITAANINRCDLIDLPPEAMLLRAEPPPGWEIARQQSYSCPVLTLGDIPSGRHRDIRQSRHRVDRLGGYTIETASPDTLDFLLAALCLLHEQRHPGGDARLSRFHHLAAPTLLRAGSLRLWVLKISNELAAGYYTLLARNRILFYLGAFNPRFAHASPGTLLMGQIIEQAPAEGRHELHLLRGAEPYKYAWGAVDRFNVQVSLRGPMVRSNLGRLVARPA
jgi:CelD/BcsL family acetyltransferase involved in cellulose biosynthesis